jgi:hypothetical protein
VWIRGGVLSAITNTAVPNEIDVDVLVGRPVALEVVKEGRPVLRQSILLKVAQWKRKAVVDADEGR